MEAVEFFYQTGIDTLKEGNYDVALAAFSKAIELDPDFFPAYYSRGQVRARLGDHPGAIRDYSQAIQLIPDYMFDDYRSAMLVKEYFFRRGTCRNLMEDYVGAIEDFTKTIKINQNDAAAHHLRGLARYMIDNYKEAREDLEKAKDFYLNEGNVEGYQEVIKTMKEFRSRGML